MSLDTDILSLNGLINYWKLTGDLSGGTAADSGPGNLPLTVTAPGVGVALTTMGGTSLRGDGTTTRAQTAIPAGHALRFADGAPFTLACWYSLPGAPGSNRSLLGRGGQQQFIRLNGIGVPTGIGQGTNFPGLFPLIPNEPALIAFTWDGREAMMFVNGVFENVQAGTPTSGSTGDPFEVFTVSNTGYTAGDISHVFTANRAVGAGELRTIYMSGAVNPLNHAPQVFDDQDARATVLLSAPALRCYSCGGVMRAREATVVSGAAVRHPACHGGRAKAIPVVLPSITTATLDDVQIGERATATTYDMLLLFAHRSSASKGAFHNGTTWVVPSNTDLTGPAGASAAAAALYRLGGAHQDSWLRRLAIASVDQLIGTQVTSDFSPTHAGSYGNLNGPMTALGFHYMLETYLWLEPTLPAGHRQRWKNSFRLAGEYYIRTERDFYTNGNIECGELLYLLLLSIVFPDDNWMTHYEHQLAKVAVPGAMKNNTAAPNANKFGWFWHVNPTLADGSDGQGYFAEGRNDGVNAPGYDPYYSHVQIMFLTRAHQWSKRRFTGGDARLLPYINGLMNLLLNKVNTGTTPTAVQPWQIDARTGLDGVAPASRNPTFIRPFATSTLYYLKRNPGLRAAGAFDVSWPAKQWAANEKEQRDNRNVYGTYLRGLGEVFVPWITASPLWGGDL